MATDTVDHEEKVKACYGDEDRRGYDSGRSERSKFRFKSTKRKPEDDERPQSSPFGDSHKSRRHHHRTKRRRTSHPPDDPSLYDDTYLPNASSSQYLDPDAAFRESLFDAMADDEGAQFWEGVYGQPIPVIDPVKKTPTGELEAMTEDEYAAHVRAEMYKKTHQHLLEEKERRDRAKKERDRLTEKLRDEEYEAEKFRIQVEESLRRGKQRKERVQRSSLWAKKWKEYESFWATLGDRSQEPPSKIPWPVWSGTPDGISKDEVEAFFLNAPTSGKPEQANFAKTLKTERVRWHPDKVQQKLGGLSVDDVKMRTVTAVFQIIDRMWTEVRDRKA